MCVNTWFVCLDKGCVIFAGWAQWTSLNRLDGSRRHAAERGGLRRAPWVAKESDRDRSGPRSALDASRPPLLASFVGPTHRPPSEPAV